MTLFEKQSIFAENISHFIDHFTCEGYLITLGEAWRTKEQAEIYAKEGKGIIDSLHCRKLAIDLNIFDKNHQYLTSLEVLKPFGLYWESLHQYNRWGGHFKVRPDADHFEMQDL